MPQQYYPQPGMGHIPEYQISGLPWAKSETLSGDEFIQFPKVTQSLTVMNHSGGDLKVAFSSAGMSASSYVVVKAGEQFNQRVRVADLYLNGAASVISVFACLTGIDRNQMPNLSGSYVGV